MIKESKLHAVSRDAEFRDQSGPASTMETTSSIGISPAQIVTASLSLCVAWRPGHSRRQPIILCHGHAACAFFLASYIAIIRLRACRRHQLFSSIDDDTYCNTAQGLERPANGSSHSLLAPRAEAKAGVTPPPAAQRKVGSRRMIDIINASSMMRAE